MKKILIYSLFAGLLLFIIWSYKLIWGKPFNINHFFERSLVEFALEEPELLTMVGIVDNTFLDFHSDKLTNASPDHRLKQLEKAKMQLKMLQRYNREQLTGQEAISYDVFHWLLETVTEGERWAFHDYPVNQTFGIQSSLPSFMDTNHQIVDESSAENYISRLRSFRRKFEQVKESVMFRAERGVIPPKFVIVHVLEEMKNFIDKPVSEHPLFNSFEHKLDQLGLDSELDSSLKREVRDAILQDVYPAYQLLIDSFEDLYERASQDVGAWRLPNGNEYYQFLIKLHTTLSLSPDDIHEMGLQEVHRIKQEMFELFDNIGIKKGSVADRFNELDELPGMFYPDTEGIDEQIIADYSELIDVLYEKTSSLFKRTPKAGVDVRRVPEFSQETAPFAYYNIPAMDGSRPGIFFINLRSIDEIAKYGMMTLAAHEAVPGHHFQLALQLEIDNVPTFRNVAPFTSYIEGWALYTEWVISEIGLFENDPYGDLGRLQAEMFRAVRLVVDTGIHHKKWSRDQAIDYMLEHTGKPKGDVVSEIERYIVMPGQALAYKIGMMHIQELRKSMEDQLGPEFDIAEFHDVVLMNGSLPLEILTEVVEQHFSEKIKP